MGCTHVKVGGFSAIVCSRGRRPIRCHVCGKAGALLCDWKIGGGNTCDQPMCDAHALEVGPGKHLCAEHQKSYAAWHETHANVVGG